MRVIGTFTFGAGLADAGPAAHAAAIAIAIANIAALGLRACFFMAGTITRFTEARVQ
jgi:hypothetical protein